MASMIVAVLALLLTGALAGLFYAFSMSVMPALDAVEPAQAEAVMRSINRKILNPWLFLPFFGSWLLSGAAGVLRLTAGEPAGFFLAAAGVTFVGAFLSTIVVNVPMNNALDAGERSWSAYSPRWTLWNTSRTIACLISLGLLGAGLITWN
ncbi:anthrone oxygenase family protein [Nonomuraea sp. NPDC050310]|uniref:anthrone oxygenase family protein n=1 Tax=unclassified Nonomuraea TaxID=2593643 RepID=UPI0033D956D0